MTGLYAHQLPPRKPTLRQLAVRAVQTDAAVTAVYAGGASHAMIDAAEDAQFEAREALYEALAEHGIDRALADSLGRILA